MGERRREVTASGVQFRGRRRSQYYLLLVAGFVIATNSQVAAQTDSTMFDSPVGVWIFPGGDIPMSRMVISRGGRICFQGSFERHNPSRWKLDEDADAVLAITLPALTADGLDVYEWRIESGSGEVAPDSLDRKTKTVYYDLSESPCRLDLGGWIFFRQSTACPTIPGLNPFRQDDPHGSESEPAPARHPGWTSWIRSERSRLSKRKRSASSSNANRAGAEHLAYCVVNITRLPAR